MKLCKTYVSAVVAGMLCLAAVFANAAVVDATWIGGSGSGKVWADAANWDVGQYPSGSGAVARFTNTVSVTMSVKLIETHVASNCTVTVSPSDSRIFTEVNSDKELVIDVAKGGTFAVSGNLYGGNSYTLVKTGEGTATFSAAVGYTSSGSTYNYKSADVRGGTLKMTCNYGPRLHTVDKYIRIRSGAKFLDARTGSGQMLGTDTVVQIDEGGTLDFNSKGGTLRGIIGAGSAVKMGSSSAYVTLRGEGASSGSSGTFTGTIDGYVTFAPTSGQPFVVGASNTLDKATMSITEPQTGSALAFAAGIGKFLLKDETAVSALAGYTTDVAGEPLTWGIVKTSAYTHTAAGDDDWSNVDFVTTKDVTEKSGGTWTIGNITMASGSSFTIDSGATGREIHFCGGSMPSITFTNNKSDYAVYFDGVDFSSSSFLTGKNGHTYHQTGGTVTLTKLNAATSATDTFTTNSVYYFISGGTLVSRPAYYQFGLGLEASGDARVRLLTGSYSGNSVTHSLSHGTDGYLLRVKGNANVYADNLNWYYYKGGACTAGVEVAENGVFETAGRLGSAGSYTALDGFNGFFRFDGGTFRSTASGDHTVPDQYQARKDFILDVRSGGAVIDVPRANDTATLTLRYGFTNCTDGVVDGGFTKKGLGVFTASYSHCLAGPVRVLNGRVTTGLVGFGGNPLGTGPVELGRGMITMSAIAGQKLASGAGGTVTMLGPGTIRKATSGTEPLELGPAGATETPFRRQNHAVMAIACGNGVNGNTIYTFDTYPVKIYGGIGDMPVFAWERTIDYSNWGKSRHEKTFKFIACDSEGNVSTRTPDYSNTFPSADDPTAFVRIAVNQILTLSANRHVGCLDVYGGNYHSSYKNTRGGISIANGVTLTVGQGVGTIAKVLLNNNFRESLDYGEATIAGAGTLDFGAAEGLFVVNDAWDTDGKRRPAIVSCRVTGTAGVTFASPYTMDNSDTEVNKADMASRMRAISVRGANTWTGGTWIDGLAVAPGRADSLGRDTVNVQGDDITGGELLFAPDYTGDAFTNALTIAGHGFLGAPALTNRWGGKAAVVAMRDVALAGGVALAADSSMFVQTNTTLTLASTVTGAGKLTVKGGGTLAIAAPITCAGGVEYAVDAVEIRPGASGTLSIDAATIPAGATLVVEGSGAADGCGTLVVDGDIDLAELNVRFGRRSGFKGNRFELVRATGTLSGIPDASTLPSRNWRYEVSGGTLVAVRDSVGTMLIVE